MASSIQPEKKTKKRTNGLPNDLFTRLQLIIALDDYPAELNDVSSSLVDTYSPHILGSCTLAEYLPNNPLNIYGYRRCITSPGRAPYFITPQLPWSTSCDSQRNAHIRKPIHASILPLLLTAHYAHVDVRQYDIVSERNSLRKFMMNDEDYIITVMRFDSTIFLRRYADYHSINKNDIGYRFEEICTTNNNHRNTSYHQLIEGRIGEFRTLILAETDAIRQQSGESIELKSHRQFLKRSMAHDWWSQAFLSGTNTIIHGRRMGNDVSQISHLKEYHVSELINNQSKIEIFQSLHRILQFLRSNVVEKRIYLLRRQSNQTTNQKNVYLYEVVDEADIKKLTFVTRDILNHLTVNN